jgi:hypothetical protein
LAQDEGVLRTDGEDEADGDKPALQGGFKHGSCMDTPVRASWLLSSIDV